MDFTDAMKYAIETYDIDYEWDEDDSMNDFFECPECGDPILRADYPKIEWKDDNSVGNYICPICESKF